jgi:hypothetical protein
MLHSNRLLELGRLSTGWPDEICEKNSQNVTQTIFGQNYCVHFTGDKSSPKFRAAYGIVKKTAQSKQAPNRPHLVTLFVNPRHCCQMPYIA